MITILVAGGAGYIGSHMVAMLVKRGYEVVVADNLRTGHWQAVKGARKLYVGDLRDAAFLDRLFTENKIDGVISMLMALGRALANTPDDGDRDGFFSAPAGIGAKPAGKP